MTETTTLDVRLSPGEFEKTERLIECLQRAYPAMTIDDAIDFIFRVGVLNLCDQSVLNLAAPLGSADETIVAVIA